MMKDTSQTSQVGETFDSSSRSVKATDEFDPFGLGATVSGVLEETVEGTNNDSAGSPIPPPQLKRIGMSYVWVVLWLAECRGDIVIKN
jgi:hypothetical protein